MANIIYHEKARIFHLYNDKISYLIYVMENGHLGQLYCGKRIHDREDFPYLVEYSQRPTTSYLYSDRDFSLSHMKQEYPVYGSTDYRQPALEIKLENGSRISDFCYVFHSIQPGKPKLEGLPATYTESDEEAVTLCVTLYDQIAKARLKLLYTIFDSEAAIARSAKIENDGNRELHLLRAMSFNLDLPDKDYIWMQFSGSWSRERYIKERVLEPGITAVGSVKGNSSHDQNPFVVLKRPYTTEETGEAFGFSLIYSGNHLMQAEVDSHDVTRVTVGIHPFGFDWKLAAGEAFQTPEAVMVYSDGGLNAMSQTFHRLYGKRLARGYWRDRPRPILLNNWEATYLDFDEPKLMKIAQQAKNCGVELFVLDDGWFMGRNDFDCGLGDWYPNPDKLPNGISSLAEKIEEMGMRFGLWFEPEMLNPDSELYRAHPDWIICTPDRHVSHGRHQYVLDFSRKEVVDYIYDRMSEILSSAPISYIKWDMNRSITECYSAALPPDRQGEVFHRYILGVYDLYDRLTKAFPEVLFESCASGGGRFDPGILYYAPQAWTSDCTDAVERLKIQYGTSMCYPISSMGAHVSAVPNDQVFRNTPLHTRANVAFFGAFGYELDLNTLTEDELVEVRGQIDFMKKYRNILQYGTFYRLKSPFEGNITVWMSVSQDKKQAIVGWYRVLNGANQPYSRVRLQGLDPDLLYRNNLDGKQHYGDELMNLGLVTTDIMSGEAPQDGSACTDFESRLYILEA
ncbi:MAG: alpha-galactosidase [Clostridiales bacterium]|nr:alpha-galactosidase [Clostridiales bacterium]